MAQHLNRWERHQTKQAKERKIRAKARHFGQREDEDIAWPDAPDVSEEPSRVGIITATRTRVFTVMENDEFFQCRLAPSIHPDLGRSLVIGDRVRFETKDDPDEEGQITGKEDRKSSIARMRGDSSRYSEAALEQHVIAANVDTAVIVAAAKNPEFHPRFIDRYLVVLQNGNVDPVICINKSDLTSERHPVLSFYRELGIPIVETSAETGEGVDLLKDTIRGKISVLVGNSGVGKSSLVNVIIPGSDIRVTEVSQKSGKGRHTTSDSALYKWDNSSYIIDTPGIRSLGIDDIDRNSLRFFFPEFEPYADHCKFRNCLHDHEPQCAVKEAVESEKLNHYRYESYIRMLHE